MEGFDECLVDEDCGDPSMVCGFAEPGCYCSGTPRACVEDCSEAGCELHETCGDDGLCTRDPCSADADCEDMPGVCVEGSCYAMPGMCEEPAP